MNTNYFSVGSKYRNVGSSAGEKVQIDSLTDAHLFNLCKTYGERARFWRQKFIGLLPEVNRRRLFEKKGFESIFVFAYKLAGLSQEQVKRALSLEKKFENLPELKFLLISGEASINKLARVASIANAENDIFLATNVKNLSKSAVETLVRDAKWNGFQQSSLCSEFVPGHKLELSEEVKDRLSELQQKGIDVNELLLELLNEREKKIAEKKMQVRQQILEKEESKKAQNKEPGRNIPRAAEKILAEEFGNKCAVKNCCKLAEHIHHGLPFSVGKTHDPRLLIPLCKEHHELAHAVNQQYVKMRAAAVRSTS